MESSQHSVSGVDRSAVVDKHSSVDRIPGPEILFTIGSVLFWMPPAVGLCGNSLPHAVLCAFAIPEWFAATGCNSRQWANSARVGEQDCATSGVDEGGCGTLIQFYRAA